MNFLSGAGGFGIFLTLLVVFGVLLLFRPVVGRMMGVDPQKISLKRHYINETHKKIEWVLFGALITVIITVFIIQVPLIFNDEGLKWYLDPMPWILVLLVISESIKAYLEWKHEENRRNYKLTLLGTGLVILLAVIIIPTGFFGAFEPGFLKPS
ncbi:hypothetical protein KP77_10700 [Jeotgalibacillus alimentarius]|uniref:Uncharacterized protein n=1 Tax=Jeotgalibacillus alimentarius TaxID=135826 RepID=A0A0C2W6B5_9BACL|nr:DUF4181 domain-containing protein [Jeotgalibacillus alimentarius]KIL51558.1 hypothetical protein KP77_10700 [Jeotgalibacillus alimentarius]